MSAPERFTTYNVMMSAESGREIPTPNGKWVRYEDYKAAVAKAREDALREAAAICVVARDKRNKQRNDYPDESRDVHQRWMAAALQSQFSADDILALIDRTAEGDE